MSAHTPPAAEPLGSAHGAMKRFAGFAVLALLLLVVQFARSMNRDLDPDEHQFVAPPALLAQFHLRPYVDYPYFHMPDLVLIYAGLTGWTSWKLLAARTISAICGSATVALLFAAGWSWLGHLPNRQRWIFSAGIALVFMSSRLFTYTSGWAWNHDSAVLCATAAVLLQIRGMRRGSIELIALAGFLAGLAMGIRLSFALMGLPMALALLAAESRLSVARRWVALSAAIAMAAVALLPAIALAAISPHRFYFGNLGYPHLSTAYYRTWNRHGMTLAGKLGQSAQKFIADPGGAMLLVGFGVAVLQRVGGARKAANSARLGDSSIAAGASQRAFARFKTRWLAPAATKDIVGTNLRRPARAPLLLGVLGALYIGVLGPTPIQPQYNYMLLPIMVLVIFDALASVPATWVVSKRLDQAVAIAAAVCGIYGLVAWYGPALLHLPTPARWKPVEQHRLAMWVRSQAGPAARVLTIEPTIPLEAGLAVYPQYATGRFVLLVTPFEPAAQRREMGMVGRADLPALLAAEPPDAVLVQRVEKKNQVDRVFIDFAKAHRYRVLASPGGSYALWLR